MSVLVIDEADITRPAFQMMLGSLRETINEQTSGRSAFFVESLDLQRISRAAVSERTVEWLADKYTDQQIDLIVASGDSSVSVANRLRARLAGRIPIVGLLTSSQSSQANYRLPVLHDVVWVRLADMNGISAQAIRSLVPGLSELLIVASTLDEANAAAVPMRAVLGEQVRIEAIASPNLDALRRRFARLGRDAAIFYLSVGRDADGRPWEIREFLRRMTEIAPRPVFGWIASYVGAGVVGGPVLDGTDIGYTLGALGARLLAGVDPDGIAPVEIRPMRLIYDWQQLRRFDLPKGRLPPEALFINRPQAIWESYPRTSALVSALLVSLSMAIGFLVRSRRQVRAANADRLSATRRLVRAQDEERVRIARDLHDDLCQEMTVLALEVDRLHGSAPTLPIVSERIRSLIDRTRHIAFGLHAAHLGSLSLPDALAAYVANVQIRTTLDIQVRTKALEASPAPSVALALFRVVQEGLQNVLKHAEATSVTVTIEGTRQRVQIEVADDGIGFDPTAQHGVNLGLATMRERMADIGGSFAVASTPFGGTTLRLTAPCEPAAA